MSHDTSTSRSFPRSIDASLVVVYYSGAGLVPKGRSRKRKASFTNISMHVDDIYVFAWTRPIQHQGLFFLSVLVFKSI